MNTYIVYDKRNGAILHKFRMTSVKDGASEGTLECRESDVLSSYRQSHVPRKYLAVATLSTYQPRSSRDRVVKYNAATGRLVAKAPQPVTSRSSSPGPKARASSGEER